MEKGKGIDIELTDEDLKMELQRLRREIQETRERRIEVEFATAVARAANAALDAKLAAKMTKCNVISKKTVAVQKEHDIFKNDITMRLQKIRGKCSFFNQEANSGPEDTHPGATEEDVDEEIIYMPPFLGRLKGGDQKITLPAYERTHSMGARVVPCRVLSSTSTLRGQSVSSKRVLASIRKDDEAIDSVGIEIWKPCPYHDAIDHNIGRCLRFRYDVEYLVNMGKDSS
uniref:Uncharacterized protein n=1 Tax=Solanum tuberosum TaxID=4113 RepID=M1AQF9_SOLTU